MTASKTLFFVCLSFISGIFIGSVFSIPRPYLIGFLLLISLFFIFSKRYVFCFCLLFLLCGVLRYQVADNNLKVGGTEKYNNKQIILVGNISEEPNIRENSVQSVINSQKILFEHEVIDLSGKILITTQKYPDYSYKDVLMLEGELKTPQVFEGFNYKDYLAKKGILSVMDFPEIEVVSKENYSLQ